MILENWRRELLDLGLRNPLLNYRPLKARGVQVVDEASAEIYNILVTQTKKMSFEAVEEGVDSAELAQPPDSHTDRKLQTALNSSDLQKRLLNSEHSARTIINNRGINVMYLALGMLRWYESDSSDKCRRAPLLLIPVTLERENVNDRFHLRYTGVDLDENLSLRTKLQQTFDLTLPPFLDNNVFDLPAYFNRLRDTIAHKPRWSIAHNEISLGFFSFSKFMLYHDLLALDKRDSPLLNRLLHADGILEPASTVDDDVPLDKQLKIADSHLVLDADSSQMQALLDVRAGRNLVIQGPPGTGKSQTITNLIADAVGRGKTVLFVSEKMAALDVVKRRLDSVGVGDGAMVLHSHRTTRGDFYDEIRRTLRLGEVAYFAGTEQTDLSFPQIDALQDAQTTLIEYSEAVNRPIPTLSSPYNLFGRQLELREKLSDIAQPTQDADAWRMIASDVLSQQLPNVRAMTQLRKTMGQPEHHPFIGSRHQTRLDADKLANIEAQSTVTLDLLQDVQQAANALTERLRAPTVTRPDQIQALLDIAEQGANAPKLNGIAVHSQEWKTADAETMADAIERMMQAARLRQEYKTTLLPEAWAQPVVTIRQGLMGGKSWFNRLTSGAYRRARTELAGLCQRQLPDEWDDQLGLVDTILEVQRLEEQIEPHREQLTRLFGDRLHEGHWHELARATYWLNTAYDRAFTHAQLELIANDPNPATLGPLHEQLKTSADAFRRSLAILWFSADFPEQPDLTFTQLAAKLSQWSKTPERLNEIVRLNQFSAEFSHLVPIIDALHNWPLAAQYLTDWAELAAISQLLNDVRIERPLLSGGSPHKSAETFRQLDRAFLQHNRLRLAQDHWGKLPRYQAGGLVGRMNRLLAYKRPTLPIRQFMQTFGEAAFRIKQVFMMSPLAIAAYLPSESITFDLVVFDEASQVRPAEALGAIARARQMVVVGDSRQLPPTSFFESIGEDKAQSEEDGIGFDEENGRFSAESILDLCLIQNVPERMLRWHYRSRHESLIAIANASFYNHNLVIFPSPDRAKQQVGLNFHHVPEGVYERGRSRSNPIEAQTIAQTVMRHAKQTPDLTLGVATFSRSQREAVTNALEQLRREDSSCEPFFNAHEQEPFFVKNLENVQGDERDVILISVGYGKGQDGKMRLNFGPLNAKGGERRLNVLTTRARRKCDVYANFRAEDINLNRSNSVGVAALKRYLAFAETGELEESVSIQQRAHAPFEALVAQRLVAQGYHVAQRVGSRAMQVDLAVADAATPQQFILAIEFDADSHRADATRDRDRIQGEVLTGLGWSVYRLYSSNWWQDEAAAFERLVAAIEAAKRGASVNDFGRLPITPIQRLPSHEGAKPLVRPLPSYQMAPRPIDLNAVPKQWHLKKSTGIRVSQFVPFFDFKANAFVFENRANRLQYGSSLYYLPLTGKFQISGSLRVESDREDINHYMNYVWDSGELAKISEIEPRHYRLDHVYDPDSRTVHKEEQTRRIYDHTFNAKWVSDEILREVAIEVDWVVQVVTVESPIHTKELTRRVQRLGGRKGHSYLIEQRIQTAVKIAERFGNLRQTGDFIWLAQPKPVQPRNRRAMPNVSRKLEMVSREELKVVLELVVRDSVRGDHKTIFEHMMQQIGVVGPPAIGSRAFITPLLNELVKEGKLVEEGGDWISAEIKN
ncbi:MAG: DUF4011 domain-containing protein [Candidatus Promineifilaceae bacterium]